MISKKKVRQNLDAAHKLLGSTSIGPRIALKIANQCNAIIRAHFNSGTNPIDNGEDLLISHLGKSVRTFFDVGANNGQWVATAVKTFSEAEGVCYEPLPSAQVHLVRVLSNLERVNWVPRALGDHLSTMEFFECEEYTDMSSLVQNNDLHKGKKHLVEVSTVDVELENKGWACLDFLKIDVEGYDFFVLKGADKALAMGLIGVVQFEYTDFWRRAGATLCAATEYLEKKGYEVYLLKKDGLYRRPEEKWGEYYGYSNYVAVGEKWKSKVEQLIRI